MNRSSSFVQRTCRIVFRFRSHVKPGRTFWDFCRKDAAGLFRTLENWLMLTSVTQRELMYVVWVTVGFRIHGAILGLLVTACSVAMGTPCGMVGLRLNIFLAGWKLSLRLILPHLVITHSLNCNFHKNKISLINTHTYTRHMSVPYFPGTFLPEPSSLSWELPKLAASLSFLDFHLSSSQNFPMPLFWVTLHVFCIPNLDPSFLVFNSCLMQYTFQ